MSPERIAKLPAWAQEHIASLTRERDRAVEALAPHKELAKHAKVVLDPYGDMKGSTAWALPDDAEIMFRMDEHNAILVGLRNEGDRLLLEVMATGGKYLTVRPSASNWINLTMESTR